jgi:acyl-CoA synthetase (AMP-forming)/AMP-acid ligase II
MGYGISIGGTELIENPTSCGHVIPGVEVRLVNDNGGDALPGEAGEVCVRSAAVMDSYLDRPEETAKTFLGVVGAPLGILRALTKLAGSTWSAEKSR